MRIANTRVQMALTRRRKRSLEEDKPPEQEPKRKKSRKQKPGLGDEIYSETSYYIQNGLRYVRPYYFSFTSHAKGRWVGCKVYDVFCREFQAQTPEYYEKAIKAGKVTVNSQPATMETVLQHNDLLAHRVHRHEPPVTAQPITIIHQDEHVLAINKPPSIPVHPCGRYRHNSVVFLLGKEHSLRNLHTIHRLDRLTSGLLLFARTLATAQRLELQIRERQVSKEYICKVEGEFPREPVVCSEPIQVVTHKLGICRVDPAGKACSTSFTRLSFDGHTSILKCQPTTGRMHQIRVHLQWLGYPIVNDPLYGHSAWGPKRGRRGEGVGSMDQVIREIVESNYTSDIPETTSETTLASTPQTCDCDCDCMTDKQHDVDPSQQGSSGVCRTSSERETLGEVMERRGGEGVGEVERRGGEGVREEEVESVNEGSTLGGDSDSDPDCTECRQVHPDPTPDQLIMYLHALRYTGPDWEYCTSLPSWACSDVHVTSLQLDNSNTETCSSQHE